MRTHRTFQRFFELALLSTVLALVVPSVAMSALNSHCRDDGASPFLDSLPCCDTLMLYYKDYYSWSLIEYDIRLFMKAVDPASRRVDSTGRPAITLSERWRDTTQVRHFPPCIMKALLSVRLNGVLYADSISLDFGTSEAPFRRFLRQLYSTAVVYDTVLYPMRTGRLGRISVSSVTRGLLYEATTWYYDSFSIQSPEARDRVRFLTDIIAKMIFPTIPFIIEKNGVNR